jgi:rod shape determining protein RodA
MTRGSSANLGFVPEPLAQLPWKVILLVLAIGCFDLLVLYSAAGGHIRPWALSQGVRFFVLLGGAMALSRVRESTWSSISLPVYGVIILMLLGVEILGKVAGGGQRWLELGIIRLQPSELRKPVIVLACARFHEMRPPAEIR